MLPGKKTYITAAVAIVTAIGAYLTETATAAEAGQLIFTALIGAFVRNGIK
jgi:hypothetical protein